MVRPRTAVVPPATTIYWKPSAIQTISDRRSCGNGWATILIRRPFRSMTSTRDSHPCSAAGPRIRTREPSSSSGRLGYAGLPKAHRISEVCGPPPWRLELQGIFLLGPVTGDGLCATHLSREPARHRVLPACATKQAVSHGVPRQSLALDFGRRERIPRLAYLRRFCPGVDCDRPPVARL